MERYKAKTSSKKKRKKEKRKKEIDKLKKKMANTNMPLPTLDWSNENKQEAFCKWLDFMTS